MNFTDVPSAVLLMQYRIARFPLQVIEERFVARLDAESSVRLVYERSFGTLDATMGNMLGDSELATRGAALAERSDARRMAARLDAAAGAKVSQASDEFTTKRKAADQKRRNAEAQRKQVDVESRRQADQSKRDAAQTVRTRTAAAKEKVDQEAAERTSAVENAKQNAHAQVKAAERAVTDAARAKLDEAQKKRGQAGATRAQADRLDELADAEKQKRRSGSS
jgi:hypothetical protein